jgi:hypothetical protein
LQETRQDGIEPNHRRSTEGHKHETTRIPKPEARADGITHGIREIRHRRPTPIGNRNYLTRNCGRKPTSRGAPTGQMRWNCVSRSLQLDCLPTPQLAPAPALLPPLAIVPLVVWWSCSRKCELGDWGSYSRAAAAEGRRLDAVPGSSRLGARVRKWSRQPREC